MSEDEPMALIPRYVEGHNLLANKSVLITAAAGAGIGFAAAKKCVEEGCRALFISDIHEGRTAQAVEALKALGGTQQVFGLVANVTDEAQVQALVNAADRRSSAASTC
jgi:3-oxoacyl-[acyl-carrier protein] reductase